jgi:beta-lactamase class D
MRLRRVSIVLLLLFVFTAATACRNIPGHEHLTENDPAIEPEPEQHKTPMSSEKPINSGEEESRKLPDAAVEPEKEDSADVNAAEDLPALDIEVIESHFQGQEGAFVWKAVNKDEYVIFNEKLAGAAFSPCSTFKIPNALIGLELGVVIGQDTLKVWDGTIHRIADWNRDHTLESAIKYSAVWYFKELARNIGAENMQRFLDEISYGNADISGGIDRFWLDSTLQISPFEQVEFLEKLYKGHLPFKEENIRMVKEMIVLDSLEGGILSGKTGTGNYGGWFVGYFEAPDDTYLFSAYMKNKQGREVKEIVIDILKEI